MGNFLVVGEPVGVVGAITPWNYPLHQIAAKVAYGLAAGCTIVLKPSEIAPLNAFVLADIIAEVGLPPGVFNLVSGVGPVVGEAIAKYPDIAGEMCMERVARVTLELGSKSANVILEDADLPKASPTGPAPSWPRWRSWRWPRPRPGCQATPSPRCPSWAPRVPGPVGQGPGLRRHRYRRSGQADDRGNRQARLPGDRVLREADRVPRGPPRHAHRPEEIFGPVLAILPFDTEDEAVAIANDSDYGLAERGMGRGSGARHRRGPPDLHRADRGQRRGVQPQGAIRWLQAVREVRALQL